MRWSCEGLTPCECSARRAQGLLASPAKSAPHLADQSESCVGPFVTRGLQWHSRRVGARSRHAAVHAELPDGRRRWQWLTAGRGGHAHPLAMIFSEKSSLAQGRCGRILILMDSLTPTCKNPPAGSPGGASCGSMQIDLRGLRPALVAIARSRQVGVAVLVRAAVIEWMKVHLDTEDASTAAGDDLDAPLLGRSKGAVLRRYLYLPAAQANRLTRMARAAALSQSAYVARLLAGLPPAPVHPDLTACRADLVRSTATLAALSGDLREFTRMLRQHASPELMACVEPVDRLSKAVGQHLEIAAYLMAALKPARGPAAGDAN